MKLLHPQVAPWLSRTESGCRVLLLVAEVQPDKLYLRTEWDNEEVLLPMHREQDLGIWRSYSAEFRWDPGNVSQHYCFKVLIGTRQVWLAADGQQAYYPARQRMFKCSATAVPPAWVKQQVFYQIMPDRFCQAQPELAVTSGEYLYANRWPVVKQDWGAPIQFEHPARYFYGGDLPGIQSQLDYLQDLGITALYLNPIFSSGSNHKYDTEDYYQVDAHLGGNTALMALRSDLTQRGMRLILDAVINHTSFNHPWFNRFGQHSTLGAYQSTESIWRSWYSFLPNGQYMSWKMHESLPVLNLANPEVQQQVYGKTDSILRYWLQPPFSVDGWRFDVAHMIGDAGGSLNNHTHFKAFRQAIKAENPQAYLFGEHFFEATDWLQGDEEDGAMNYFGFALPVRAWLTGLDVAYQANAISSLEFVEWLKLARSSIPYDNQLAQFNLLDSHDTQRFFSLVAASVERMSVAVVLLMTYPGVPCIYYGDEIGLQGAHDPDCRRCFDWDRQHWHLDLWSLYQTTIALRHQRLELQAGAYQELLVSDDLVVFARYLATSLTLIAVQRGLSECVAAIDLRLIPMSGLVWSSAQGLGQAWVEQHQLKLSLPALGYCWISADKPEKGLWLDQANSG